ncbi:hypothetical protein [Pseudalkalibacillus caeni]|nr:hypothetical protein [Pseudalkalibacillus caeni]
MASDRTEEEQSGICSCDVDGGGNGYLLKRALGMKQLSTVYCLKMVA